MATKNQLKRRQHHVWKSYLRAWATDEKIFCLQDGKIFEPNIRGVAVERDFYKLQTLSTKEAEFIRLLIGSSPTLATPVHEDFLKMFSIFPLLKDNMPAHMASDAEFVALVDQAVTNAEEDFHSRIEGGMTAILDAIRRRDISFYNDAAQSGKFLHFLSLQSLRTKGVRERIVERVTALPDVDISKCWPILRHIFAVNAGASLFLERKKRPFFLIENDTSVPFITGDQPVINLLHSPNRIDAPTLLAFYYPVTPWLAVILDEVDERSGYGAGALSIDQVSKLNCEMQAAAFSQVFGHSREVLTSLRPRENTHDREVIVGG
ncbi:MAG: hypothetical protein JWR16_2662 [Nevskia sp.]|nr:hypothetical protein [Nevskia sp.]